MNKLLGKRIKELRTAHGLTQEYIAKKIGVSRQKYARLENGTNSVTLDLLTKISEVLSVSVNDITSVLDKQLSASYRGNSEDASAEQIFDMLDLFYANKHLYERLR